MKRTLAVAVYNHYEHIHAQGRLKRPQDEKVQVGKSSILLLGPTGTGKTYLTQSLARMLDVPFAIADAMAPTETGYMGEDVENMPLKLAQAADDDVKRTEVSIIYIDEIDRTSCKSESPSITWDVSGEGVQQALFKITEGTVASAPSRRGRKYPQQEYLQLDTSNVLFICAGVSMGMGEITSSHTSRRGIGFDSELHVTDNEAEALNEAMSEDLHKFRLIPELVGRLPVVTATEELTGGDLTRILTKSKNALVRQYEHVFELDGVRFQIDGEAPHEISREVIARGTSTRGLRPIMGSLPKEATFKVPSRSDVEKVVFDAAAVKNGRESTFVLKKAKGIRWRSQATRRVDSWRNIAERLTTSTPPSSTFSPSASVAHNKSIGSRP